MNESDKVPSRKPSTSRKPYSPPRLVSYGHVKDLVQGDAGGMTDSGTTRMCRVAEILYGADDPRTLMLRAWLGSVHSERRRGWPLVELYRRCGPTLARLMGAGFLPRGLFLALFDRLGSAAADFWARVIADGRHRRSI